MIAKNPSRICVCNGLICAGRANAFDIFLSFVWQIFHFIWFRTPIFLLTFASAVAVAISNKWSEWKSFHQFSSLPFLCPSLECGFAFLLRKVYFHFAIWWRIVGVFILLFHLPHIFFSQQERLCSLLWHLLFFLEVKTAMIDTHDPRSWYFKMLNSGNRNGIVSWFNQATHTHIHMQQFQNQ